jgi:hypothetical protein
VLWALQLITKKSVRSLLHRQASTGRQLDESRLGEAAVQPTTSQTKAPAPESSTLLQRRRRAVASTLADAKLVATNPDAIVKMKTGEEFVMRPAGDSKLLQQSRFRIDNRLDTVTECTSLSQSRVLLRRSPPLCARFVVVPRS